jgi:predicted lipoprotein with Yx(FWY)xxD motif
VHKKLLTSAVAAATLALAGCASAGSGTATAGSQAPAASSAALRTAQSPLGTVVVDGKGRTVYSFDKDTIGAATSACTGVCVGLWPELTTTSSAPKVSGVTGKVGTAPTTGGARQLTLDGHRLYTFSGDSQSGQVNGEAYMNQWWVLAPSGQLIKKGAAASSSMPSVTY